MSAVDPMKGLARHYDAEVVAKGGGSIFSPKPVGTFTRERQFRRWIERSVPHVDRVPGPMPHGRPAHIAKPGRIVATTLGIIGHAKGDEEDFR